MIRWLSWLAGLSLALGTAGCVGNLPPRCVWDVQQVPLASETGDDGETTAAKADPVEDAWLDAVQPPQTPFADPMAFQQ